MERQFTATRPNQLWVADLMYVRTRSGSTDTALIVDVYSRYIVGWQTPLQRRADLVRVELELTPGPRNLSPPPSRLRRTGHRPKSVRPWYHDGTEFAIESVERVTSKRVRIVARGEAAAEPRGAPEGPTPLTASWSPPPDGSKLRARCGG